MNELHLIVAMSQSGAIGQAGKLPWHAPEDLKRFRRLTTGHAVIMGRKTYESIGRPLPGRHNIVLATSLIERELFGANPVLPPSTSVCGADTLERAFEEAYRHDSAPFIIGGASVYAEALPLVTTIHRTVIAGEFPEADVFMPKGWHDGFDLRASETGEAPVLQCQTLTRPEVRK